MVPILIGLLVAAAAALIYWLRSGKIQGIPEPPGNILIGHVCCLGDYFYKTFLDWKQTVGPVFQLRFLHKRVIIFNDKDSISQVFSMRESGGRLRVGFFLGALEKFGAGLILDEGHRWEEQRQFYMQAFRTFGIGRVETERSFQDEIQMMLTEWENLDGAPFQLGGYNSAYALNAVWSILASERIQKNTAVNLVHGIEKITSTDTIGDIAALVHPGFAGKFTDAVQEKMKGLQALSDVAITSIANHHKNRRPNEPRDVIDAILDKIDKTRDENSYFHEKNMKPGYALYDLVAATLDTISATLNWLMLLLAQNPSVVSKLYSEIDGVLGDDLDSWPSLSHRDSMPYTQACILEALRMGSVAPIGFPHNTLEDFQFNGALIPKGTLLIMNIYAVHYDPQVWDQPNRFKPERFLTPEGDKIDVSVKNQILPFGVGRRACPGNVVAMDSMFLHVANSYRKFAFEVVNGDGDFNVKPALVRHLPANLKFRANLRH